MASSPQYASERPAVYTVGHSTRTIPEFVELLNRGPVELVVDIRSVPRSRTNPQFNLDALPEVRWGRSLDRRRLEFSGLLTAAGWLRQRD
jgi:uncharacterized protein (DUF488 family)